MSLVPTTPSTNKTQPDVWESPKETWQFVTIPEENSTGRPFPTIGLNKEYFEAGKTYQVPKQIAAYILERIKVHNRSEVRLLQPNADLKALTDINNAAAHSTPGGRAIAIDGSGIQTA